MRLPIAYFFAVLFATTAQSAIANSAATITMSNFKVEVDGVPFTGFNNDALLSHITTVVPELASQPSTVIGENLVNQVWLSKPNVATSNNSAVVRNDSLSINMFNETLSTAPFKSQTSSEVKVTSFFSYTAYTLLTVSIDVDIFAWGDDYINALGTLSLEASNPSQNYYWSTTEYLHYSNSQRHKTATLKLSLYSSYDSEIELWVRGNTSSSNIYQPLPEPSSYAMLGLGLGVMGFAARRRK